MKILLVRPFVDSSTGNSPPLSIMYLSSYLKSKQIDVKLIDKCIEKGKVCDFSKRNPYIQGLVQEIKEFNPDIIGMTLFSREIKEIAAFCKFLKAEIRNSFIVLGGPHPTVMPQETLEQIPECDFVVRGESEAGLYDLIASLSHGGDLMKVRGLSFRNGSNEICHCQDAEIIANLDLLPFPDREALLYNYQKGNYGSLIYGNPSDIIMTSRGCPFQCSFCFKVCTKYRSRSSENVLSEIALINKMVAPQYIQIMDDSFTIQKDRCIKILDSLIKKKYSCKFKVRSRVNAIDRELLAKMKEAGVDVIVYGFESGSQKMLNAFNKRTTVEENIAACQLTRKAGINCFGDIMLFYPGETRETLKETMSFIKRAQPTGVAFHVLSPLPKTLVYEEALKNNTLIGRWDVNGETPWIKSEFFKDITEMGKIAKKMQLKTIMKLSRILWFLRYCGAALKKNPVFFMKMIILNIAKDRKY